MVFWWLLMIVSWVRWFWWVWWFRRSLTLFDDVFVDVSWFLIIWMILDFDWKFWPNNMIWDFGGFRIIWSWEVDDWDQKTPDLERRKWKMLNDWDMLNEVFGPKDKSWLAEEWFFASNDEIVTSKYVPLAYLSKGSYLIEPFKGNNPPMDLNHPYFQRIFPNKNRPAIGVPP